MISTLLNSAAMAISGAAIGAPPANAVPPLQIFHRDASVNNDRGGALEQMFFRGTGASESAQATDGLFMMIFWFSVFFFVVLMFLMVYWVIKYRRKPGVPVQVSPSHNTILELVWTIVPSASLLVIFFLGFWTYMEKQVPTSTAYEISITGKKWVWLPTYPNGASTQWQIATDERTNPITGETTRNAQLAPVIIVPEDTDIRLRMVSDDVIHSFWIPDFRVKGDVFPNRYTGYTFKTPKLEPGAKYQDHWIFCAEYCGDSHSEMAAILRVMPYTDFDKTIAGWNTDGLTMVELGNIVAQQQGCFACHSINGADGTGPTWQGLYGSSGEFDNAPPIDFKDENYIRESVINPNAKLVSGRAGMAAYTGLSEKELDGIVWYIRSLSEKGQEVNASLLEGEAGADGDADGAPADGESDAGEAGSEAESDAGSDAGMDS
jgi:cytochrome c oxidase subunit 2